VDTEAFLFDLPSDFMKLAARLRKFLAGSFSGTGGGGGEVC